jgi:branched-chain amino acid transport system substrate-binding protein
MRVSTAGMASAVTLGLLGAILIVRPAAAQTSSMASDSAIKIGNTMPYTGPAAAYGIIGKTVAAYFSKINAEGGVNGRKIQFKSYDDAYNPANTVQLTRKLVEEDGVLLIFNSLGTATSAAVRSYLNAKRVPQLFVGSGASLWDQPQKFPWTMGFSPSYQTEAHIYAQYLLENHPKGKIAILYQNDEFGKDYVNGFKDGLAGKIPIVAEAGYMVTDSTIDPQLAKLKSSGADIFFDVTTPKFAIQAIRRSAELGWKPVHIVTTVNQSVSSVLQPAGLQNSEGLLSAGYIWEATDPAAAQDPAYPDWVAFMDRYLPNVDKSQSLAVYGYVVAEAMVEVLRRCGDDLSRENVMKQAATLKGLKLPMVLPGIVINTSATDHAPYEQMFIARFSGGHWGLTGPVRSGIDPGAVSDSFKAIFRYGSATRQTAGEQNANTVTMMTGSFGGTYVQIGADLAAVLDDGANFRLLPIVGRGSVQSVADILFLKGVDVGIVRKDTLAYLERKGYAGNIRNQLGYVSKLYNEEMHVLASKDIRTIQDLDGKSVAVDLPDGGTFVTSINVFERLGIKPHLIYVEPRIALEMLRKGEIDALIAVEGKPLPWLSRVQDTNLHLVPVDFANPLQDDYLPAQLTSEDYPNLIANSERVGTIAAEAILASYNWQPSSNDRYRRLSRFVEIFFSHMDQLKRPPFHPKWRELAPHATIAGWTRTRPAQEWLEQHPLPNVASVKSEATLAEHRARFLKFLDQHSAERGGASVDTPEGREAIFREFLKYLQSEKTHPAAN